jgi:Fe-S-cluster containining protein
MAAYLNLTEIEFTEHYCRINATRTGLALVDKADGSCIFLEAQNCHVNPVKPQQCRDFPNLWNFPGFEKICQARPIALSPEQWRDRIMTATGRTSIKEPIGIEANPHSFR